MGLDISVYTKLEKAKGNEAFDKTGELKYAEGWVQFYINPDFSGRAPEIEDRCAYKYSYADGFRAGSYGFYSCWREQLAELAGYQKTEYESYGTMKNSSAYTVWENPVPGPFMELINFSDCEGVIGASVSKKLAKDFADFQHKADKHVNEDFRRKYKEWREAFELASDNGAVEFH